MRWELLKKILMPNYRCGHDMKWICSKPEISEKCYVKKLCGFYWSYYIHMKQYNRDAVPNIPEASTLFV
ncbi:hypothetical protein KM043_012628 [Ampulex compressa]|nr:hypothetical protein KM043_012628 [Ampulex compressa]